MNTLYAIKVRAGKSKKKKCSACGRKLSRLLFYAHPKTADGLFGKCKTCVLKERQKSYVAKTQNAPKLSPFPFSIRMSSKAAWTEWYFKRFAAQEGRCAFCGRHEAEVATKQHPSLVLDHDHAFHRSDSRGWRRLLCSSCNLMYGHAREKATTLLAAAHAAEFDAENRAKLTDAARVEEERLESEPFDSSSFLTFA
jgi:Recombination endonuclease VII